MKIKVLILTMILSCFSVVSLAATDSYKIEEGIESSELEIRLSSDLTGIVKGPRCEGCEVILLKITPDTKVKIDDFKTVLTNVRRCAGNPSTVIYNIKTREVTSVSCER